MAAGSAKGILGRHFEDLREDVRNQLKPAGLSPARPDLIVAMIDDSQAPGKKASPGRRAGGNEVEQGDPRGSSKKS